MVGLFFEHWLTSKNESLFFFVGALQKADGITLYANLRKVILQLRLPGEDPAYLNQP